MMKVFLVLALTCVAGVAGQEAASGGESSPEPYSYAYQTESHSASEQRDQQGRVSGFYTLTDADGRERRVEYTADEAGFRAKVATNEVGTKSESPANVEFVASEPSPAQYAAAQYAAQNAAQYSAQNAAQYSAQYSAQGGYQAPAQVQGAQYVRQQTFQSAAGPAVQSGFARSGYAQQQQYAYRPYGSSGYYSSSVVGAAPAVGQASAYGGYGSSAGFAANNGYAYGAQQPGPAGYVSGPAGSSQYYNYKSQTVGSAAPVSSSYSAGYRYASQPGGTVSSSYRSVSAPVASGAASYSSGSFPAGVSAPSVGFETPVGGVSSSSSRSSNYQGSSNYLVLQKRDAEEQQASN